MSIRPIVLALGLLLAGAAGAAAAELPPTWKDDLFAAREAAWRGYFGDPDALEALLTDDFVGIGGSGNPWRTKAVAVAASRQLTAQGVRLATLSFPDNVVQQYGEVGIIYSTFSYSTTQDGKTDPVITGRVTELFRWDGKRWLHTGWHLGPMAP